MTIRRHENKPEKNYPLNSDKLTPDEKWNMRADTFMKSGIGFWHFIKSFGWLFILFGLGNERFFLDYLMVLFST